MIFSHLFFDLDATLYPASNGLWNRIKSRINHYLTEKMGFSTRKAQELRQKYYLQYGTTLAGLMNHHQVDPDHYLDFVHNVQLEKFIGPDPELRDLLSTLPQSLWVFTNADRNHAERVLDLLNIDDLFKGIIDINALDFQVKPHPQAYQRALKIANPPSPSMCTLFDDLPQNLPPAKELGFHTVLVNENENCEEADLHMDSLLDLPHRMPYLW